MVDEMLLLRSHRTVVVDQAGEGRFWARVEYGDEALCAVCIRMMAFIRGVAEHFRDGWPRTDDDAVPERPWKRRCEVVALSHRVLFASPEPVAPS